MLLLDSYKLMNSPPLFFLVVAFPLNKLGFFKIALLAARIDQNGWIMMVFSIVVTLGETVVVVREVEVELELDVVVVEVVVAVGSVILEDTVCAEEPLLEVGAATTSLRLWDMALLMLFEMLGLAFVLSLFFRMVSLLLNGDMMKFSKFLIATEFVSTAVLL